MQLPEEEWMVLGRKLWNRNKSQSHSSSPGAYAGSLKPRYEQTQRKAGLPNFQSQQPIEEEGKESWNQPKCGGEINGGKVVKSQKVFSMPHETQVAPDEARLALRT